MKHRWVLYLGVFLACHTIAVAVPAAPSGEVIRAGAGDTRYLAVAAAPGRVYAATEHAVHESQDGGKTWEQRFRPPRRAMLRALASQGLDSTTVLAATSQGLFGSFDGGLTWSTLFTAPGEEASDCTFVAFHPADSRRAVLGTKRGVYLSADGGRGWQEADVPQAARSVIHAAFHPREPMRLYLVSTDGLWVGDLVSGSWQLRRSLIHAEDAVEQPASVEASQADEEDGSLHRLSAIAIDPRDPERLFLATSRGVEASDDGGLTWRRLSRTGLDSARMTDLTVHRSGLFAASLRGVARYEPAAERWAMSTQGTASGPVHDLAEARGQLWAATDAGLVKLETPPDDLAAGDPPTPQELLANFTHEPTISQVRDVAIRYAEVHPSKIRHWRQRAALQALLPDVSVGYDYGRSRDISIDEGSFPAYQFIKSSDRDDGFDASVNWELGNLIWNDDQTSIDVRSKLMVELRDDIVDEVTRTYFERRRIQVALLIEPPKTHKALVDKELRIQELTALLDGLTGGYFSGQMRVNGN
jgi:photosystem II stability/assembly factor-like uncharacterized protein